MLLPALLFQLALATPAAMSVVDQGAHRHVPRADDAPKYRPSRAQRPPTIDGRDDDAMWKNVPAITDFRVFEPTENGDPSVRTEARFAYDTKNLYVLVRSFDPHPDSILSVLERRDGLSLSDDVIVGIDSYNDKRTGYMFRLSTAGTMADGYTFNDGEEDWGWNAVWQGAARVDSLGWIAEFRIPLSQLRYVPSGENTFGIFVTRRMARRGERIAWPLIRRSKTGSVRRSVYRSVLLAPNRSVAAAWQYVRRCGIIAANVDSWRGKGDRSTGQRFIDWLSRRGHGSCARHRGSHD